MEEVAFVVPWFPTVITIFALIQYMVFGIAVGRARVKYEIPAPAMNGNEEFERVIRVQQNTLEQIVFFLPSLWLFALIVNDLAAGILGIVWIAGREIYAMSYIKDPNKRGLGFGLTFIPSALMAIGALIGVAVQQLL